jgi:hypothetical protein
MDIDGFCKAHIVRDCKSNAEGTVSCQEYGVSVSKVGNGLIVKGGKVFGLVRDMDEFN